MDQLVPFQRSASAGAPPLELKELPTAVQAVADVHETAAKKLLKPFGLEVVSMDQLVPFQRSARVRGLPTLFV
jgi:hypothetical protein